MKFNNWFFKGAVIASVFLSMLFFSLAYAENQALDDVLPLTLSDVTALALKNNFDIKIARLEALIEGTKLENSRSIFDILLTLEADYSEDELAKSSSLGGTKSRTSNYKASLEKKMPSGTTLELDLNDKRSWSDSSFVSVNPSHNANAKLDLTQEISKNAFGLIDRGAIVMTELAVKNADFSTLDKIEKSIAGAQKAYWQLVLSNENLLLKENMLKEAKQLYDVNKEKLQIGMIEKPDFLASDANVTLRETEVLIARNEAKDSAEKLKAILDLKDGVSILPGDNLNFYPVAVSFTEALKEAVKLRRDYQRAENEVKSYDINLQIMKNSLWPQIDLEATIQKNGLDRDLSDAVREINSENNPYYYVGLKFEVPLENKKAKSQHEKAGYEKTKALLALKKTEREIAVGIDKAVREIELAREIYLNRTKTVKLQEEKLNEELKLFNAGRSSSYFVINYQEDLHLAKFQVLKALYDYYVSLIDLKVTQNSLLQELGVKTR